MSKVVNNLAFRMKLLLGFASVFVVTTALAVALSLKIEEAREGVHWTNHTYTVIGELKKIISSMVDKETGLRGYLLAG